MKIPHCYYFKGSYYFRKVISAKYLKNRSKPLILRRSLKQAIPRYYSILEANQEELAKLTIFLSERVTILLKHKQGILEVDDIIDFINELCNEYTQSAMKENSSLEVKRIEALEYINENGIQNGYSIQAISKEYKEVITQYDNLQNESNTIEIGSRIVKRSNISKEQILEIPPAQLVTFYEMLIKAEKKVLEHDIRLYISRNLHQFISLLTDLTKSEPEKIEEAYYAYLDLVRVNDLQIDYLNLIAKQKITVPKVGNSIFEDKDALIQELFQQMKINEEEKVLNVSAEINYLAKQYTTFRKYKKKREAAALNSISLFADYLNGNGAEYKAKNISEVTESDILEFEELLTEAMPKNKSKELRNLNLFELVVKRKKENKARLTANSVKTIENHIKGFWRYLAKYHKNLNLDSDLISALHAEALSREKKEDLNEEDPRIRAFSTEEINEFIEFAYSKDKFKKIIVNSPRNFYIFVFCFFCGMRHEEPLLAHINDLKVQEKNGKRYFYLYLNEDQPYQHLKGKNSHRNMPITDLLIDLGFLNYVDLRRKRGCETIFDFPKSASTSSNSFFQRNFQKLFPDKCDTRENRDLNLLENFVHFRSFRKNFSNFLFEENRTEFDTEKNKERIMAHDNAMSGRYIGRLEPMKAYEILNSIDFESEINVGLLKDNVKDHYKEIKRDLAWVKEKSPEEWKVESKVKRKRGRKI